MKLNPHVGFDGGATSDHINESVSLKIKITNADESCIYYDNDGINPEDGIIFDVKIV